MSRDVTGFLLCPDYQKFGKVFDLIFFFSQSKNDKKMTGWDYFKRAMTTDYANFSGRARRSEYWYFTLFLSLFIIAFVLIMFVLIDAGGSELWFAPIGILFLGIIIPNIAVTVRRLHDTGNSGWLYLLSLIPYIGSLIMLVFALIDSKPGPNKWGPNPKDIGNDEYSVTDHLIEDDLV